MLGVAVIAFSTVLSPLNAQAATSAASKAKDLTWLAQSKWYYDAVSQCMGSVGSWNVSGDGSDITAGKWYYSGFTIGSVGDGPGGFLMRDVLSDIGDDGFMNCAANDNELLRAALAHWGISGTELACGTFFKRSNDTTCDGGNGGFNWKESGMSGDAKKAAFQSFIKSQVYGGATPSLSGAANFIYYRDTFANGCAYGATPLTSNPGGSQVYEIASVATTGAVSSVYYVGDQKGSTKRWATTNPNAEKTCDELAALVEPGSSYANEYKAWARDNPEEVTSSPGATGETGEDTATSCIIDGVGWIICSAAIFLANVTDSIYGMVANILEVPPINVDVDDGSNGAYNAWNIMRQLANVVFVIAFLVIIYSQLTSTGVSNYGVKKLLPRLMVVAVLVNVSYWIGAIAVDVSNIIGHGIYDIFASVKNRMNIGISENWGNIIVGLLAGQALAVQGGTLVIGSAAVLGFAAWAAGSSGILAVVLTVLPMLLLAVLAVFVVAFLLIARQAIVIILIMISPLAFVAMLFPNTEKYYKKWLELLMTMLTMFPLVSFVFGGAQVAGLAILSTAEGATDPVAAGLAIIVGQLVMVLPFFFLFTLIGKFSGSQLGALAGKLRASGMKAINGVRKYSDPLADRKRKLAMSRLQSGQITRRYNRRGQETTLSKLSGSAGGLVGGVLNTFGASKHADEVHTKANEMDVQRGYANTAAGQAADAALRTATLQDAIDEKARETNFEATAPLDLKLKAKLADEQLKVEKAQTNQVAVEAATLMAQAANESDPVKKAQLEYRASLRAGGDLSIAHDLHAAHTDAALASEATNVAGRLQQQEYARQVQTDPALLSRATGIGGAAAQSRVLASTQHTLQKAVADDVEAERSSVANMTDVTALKAEFNARDASGAHIASAARRAALAERAITIGDPADYHDIVDSIGATTGNDAETNVMRQTVARAVAADSQLFKAGDIDAIATGTLATRTGAPNTVALTVRENVEKGVLSAEKTVGASNGDLKFAHANASPKGQQMLRDAALEVKGNDTLRGKIKHNATAIENLSRGLAP